MKKYLSILLILCMCLTACTATNQATSTSEKSQSDTTSGEAVQSGQEEKAAKAPDTSKPEGTLEVHYIDVGQGDATLIKCGSHAMLIDGGNDNKGTTVQLYLKKQGVESLDYVIGTHPDADHIGGLDVIVYKYNCDTVIMPDYEKDTKTYQELVDVIHDKNMKITYPVVGEQYALGEAKFTIIAPNSNSYGGNANDYSVAILLEYGKNRFLFTGDAEEASEAEMLTNGIDISADVYKVAHHGSRSASTQEFLNAVHPKYAVISCGEGNSYGHPHAEVLNRLRSMGVEVFRTDEQGSIIASSDGENITWNCSATDSWQSGEQTESDRENSEDENSGNAISDAVTSEQTTYVLNTNTKKFHRETCGSVSQIKEENFQKVQMNREELEQSGYSPCKNCNP